MKKLLLITITALSINAVAQTSIWTALNSGTTNNLLGVSAVNCNLCTVDLVSLRVCFAILAFCKAESRLFL